MLVQSKEVKLYLNIAELLRALPSGELFKISRNKFEVADDFEQLARDTTGVDVLTDDQRIRGVDLLSEVYRIDGVNDLIKDYSRERTAKTEDPSES